MRKKDRQREILTLLHQVGNSSVSNLCEIFNVTDMTIRRDLTELEQAGKIVRSHGGAVLAESKQLVSFPFHMRLMKNYSKKMDIAHCAYSLIKDEQRIFISSSSTTYCLASQLDNTRNLLVITDAINIASQLLQYDRITLILIGGQLRGNTLSTVGSFAESMTNQLSSERIFMSVTAIGPDGSFYSVDTIEAGVTNAMLSRNEEVMMLADSSKIGNTDLVRLGRLGPKYTLITNPDAPEECLQAYRNLGCTVILASERSNSTT